MRTVNSARNPIWANYEKTAINLEVDFDELDEIFVDFTASSSDPEPHGADLYNRAIAGEFGEIADFPIPDNIVGEEAMVIARQRRNQFLSETDYIEMPTKWATLTPEQQAEWSTYRNALRDLPSAFPNLELHWNDTYTDLAEYVNVTWPERPGQ